MQRRNEWDSGHDRVGKQGRSKSDHAKRYGWNGTGRSITHGAHVLTPEPSSTLLLSQQSFQGST